MKVDFLTNFGKNEMPSESYLKLSNIIDGKFDQLDKTVKEFGRTEDDYKHNEVKNENQQIIEVDTAAIADACDLLDSVLIGENPFEETVQVTSNDFSILDELIDDSILEEEEKEEDTKETELYDEQALSEENVMEEPASASEGVSNTPSPVIGVSAFDSRHMNSHWLSENEDGTTRWDTYQQTKEILENKSADITGEDVNAVPEKNAIIESENDISVNNNIPVIEEDEEFDDFDDLEFEIEFEDDNFSDVIIEYEDDDDDIFSVYVETTDYDENISKEEDNDEEFDEIEKEYEDDDEEEDDDEDNIPTMNYTAGTLGPIDDEEDDEDTEQDD